MGLMGGNMWHCVGLNGDKHMAMWGDKLLDESMEL